MHKSLILVLLLLPSLAVSAQQKAWSLADCIGYALENNISIKQSQINVAQKEIELNTAEGRRLPGVSSGASQNFSFGRGLTADNTYANTNTTSTSFSIGADMTLFQGFNIKNNIALSRLNLQTAASELAKAKDDIRVAVAQGYVQILYNMEILDVAESQIAIDEEQLSRIEEMVANGKASGAEVSAQKATLAQSRLSSTQAENNLSLALLELTQLLELPSPEGFTIVRPSVEAFEIGLLMDPEEIFAKAENIKPAVISDKLRLMSADKNIDIAKGGFLPSLSLSGGLGTNYYTSSGFPHSSFFNQLSNNFSQYVGLSLNVPIFSRFSNRNSLKAAKLSYESQELQLENTRKALYKEIQQAYYNAVAAQDKYISSREARQSAADAFELMSAKYENGKASITEFNEAKGRLISADSNLVQAQYEYLYQSRLLDFYKGEDIVF